MTNMMAASPVSNLTKLRSSMILHISEKLTLSLPKSICKTMSENRFTDNVVNGDGIPGATLIGDLLGKQAILISIPVDLHGKCCYILCQTHTFDSQLTIFLQHKSMSWLCTSSVNWKHQRQQRPPPTLSHGSHL